MSQFMQTVKSMHTLLLLRLLLHMHMHMHKPCNVTVTAK